MDRYITREKGTKPNQSEHLVGNQMIAFSPTSTGGNNITTGNQQSSGRNQVHIGGNCLRQPQNQNYLSTTFVNNPNVSATSGIDPRYLSAYADNSASYVASGTFKNSEPSLMEEPKTENPDQTKSRSLLQMELFKSGPRVFSGPVEKVLKWHKSLQDIGILIIYEIVGKCVNVRAGECSAKNLVVRDESGPAMQVIYYEIDFLMSEIKPPCTVRVIGRMLAGTNRLHAFNVRLATGDDVATLPRRAAVAAHHVGKLCKKYGLNN